MYLHRILVFPNACQSHNKDWVLIKILSGPGVFLNGIYTYSTGSNLIKSAFGLLDWLDSTFRPDIPLQVKQLVSKPEVSSYDRKST